MMSLPPVSLVVLSTLLLVAAAPTNAQDVVLDVSASSDVVEPGETTLVTATVSNTGLDTAFGVEVEIALPDGIASFREPTPAVDCPFSLGDLADTECDPRETATWFVGNLGSGQSRALALLIEADTEEGRILTLHASARASSEGAATQSDVFVGRAFATPVEGGDPDVFSVRSYPSPFRIKTTVEVTLDAPASAVVEVFDLTGRRVATVHDGPLPAGRSALEWAARGAADGLYLYRVRTPAEVRTGTVVKVAPR